MRLLIAAAIAGGIVTAVVVAIFASSIPTKDYSLTVDALKDEQSLFTNTRVVLSNTGRLPLTDVTVDYGGGQKEDIGTLDAGQRRTVSPPDNVQLDTVTVTANPGITVVQEYRTPIKLPGMMGS